jgi:histidinol-phosphatase
VTPLDLRALRDTALGIAQEAAPVALHHFERGVAATAKADGSPVTVADLQVEALVRRRLAEVSPFPVVGEEEGGELSAGEPTWVLDPIDGTENFLRGVPIWGLLLALMVGDRPVVGIASAPALGERWDAASGFGARRNGEPVGVSAVRRLSDAHVLHGGLDWFRAAPGGWDLLGRLADRAWRTRGFGDFWMHLLVAGGMADVALERDLRIWDLAATACIVEQAGGRVTSWDGGSALATGEALVTNGLLHAQVLELVR